jgi:hypothetical protein
VPPVPVQLAPDPVADAGGAPGAPAAGPPPPAESAAAPTAPATPAGAPAGASRSLDDALGAELDALERAGLRRRLRPASRGEGPTRVPEHGPPLVDFAANDYLGLAGDPRPAAAAAAVLAREGLGAGAARLLGGDHPLHHALERALAGLKGASGRCSSRAATRPTRARSRRSPAPAT